MQKSTNCLFIVQNYKFNKIASKMAVETFDPNTGNFNLSGTILFQDFTFQILYIDYFFIFRDGK